MKKFFLIPLMTLMCSVMAWGTETTVSNYADLKTALTGSTYDVVKLGDSFTCSESSKKRIDIGRTKTLDLNGKTLTFENVQIKLTSSNAFTLKNSSATKAKLTANNNSAIASYAPIYCEMTGANVIVDGDVDIENTYNNSNSYAFGMSGDDMGFSPSGPVDASLTFKTAYKGTVESKFSISAGKVYFEAGCQGKFKTLPSASLYEVAGNAVFGQVDGYWQLPSAPSTPAAQIGETGYATFADAYAAATSGQTIILNEDAEVADLTIDKSIGLAGDHALTVTGNSGFIVGGNSAVTLTLAGVTLNSAYNIRVKQNITFNIQSSTTNVINKGIQSYDLNSGSTFTISGAGNLTINGSESSMTNVFLLDRLQVEASATNLIVNTGSKGLVNNSAALKAGKYSKMKEAYIADGYESVIDGDYYKVQGNEGRNFLVHNGASRTHYETWAAAYAAANHGDSITLKHSVANAGTISKGIVVYENSRTYANANAGSGYTAVRVGEYNNYVLNSLVEFLNGEGGDSYTLSQSAVLPAADGYKQFTLSGNKTLTIADGVTLSTNVFPATGDTREPIIVPGGAKLTLKGNGTIAADIWLVKVEEGGTLIVGEEGSNDALTIRTTVGGMINNINYVNAAINNYGTTTIYNVNIDARSYALHNRANAKMTVLGGRYIGKSTSSTDKNGSWAYAVINGGNMVMKDAYVQGIHGAVSCESGNGTLELNNCDLRALNTNNVGGVHYALYVCTKAMVSAYNTKFYSDNASNTIYIGDNDSQNSFGLIYLYDGCKSNRKLFVQQKRGQDDDLLFPVLVSEESAWYKVATRAEGYAANDDRLLPANIEYQAINEEIDGLTYLFATHSTAADEKSIDSNDPTIPWQQNTTWSDDVVPETTTAVVIPEGKEVVVSNDPAITGTGVDKDTAAVAEQIFIGDGAKLTVQTGTTLSVGEGGINVANGGQIVVEPGAVVTVGSAGLVTTEEEALVISANTEDQGVFLLQPDVTENTQPKATVKLISKAKQVGDNDFVWERFAIPTIDGNATIYDNERLDTVTIYNNGAFAEGLAEWNGSAWVGVSSWKNLQPFKGYQLTNNSKYGNVCYTFEGNLVGNADMDYQFTASGFGFFGNSYTGDIDILKLITGFDEESQMQKSVWIYDPYTDGFKVINESNYGKVYYGQRKARHGQITDIRTMQAFLMNSFKEGDNTATVDYSSAIWGNPKYGLVSTPDPAPAKRVAANEDMFTVYVAGAKQEDEVSFIRSNAYSATFDNGADASKWMNSGLNLYVATEDGELASVASDEIVDMTIAFQSGNETEYTLGFDNLRGEQFELRDVLTGATIQMTEGATYTFSQEANTTVPARFQIIGAKKVTTGIENMEEGATVQQKVVKNGVLYILRDNKWYNAQGQFVK